MKIRDVIGHGVYGPSKLPPLVGSNISRTASWLARAVNRRGLEPGTADWFRAWFSRPYLTGERPFR